MGTAAPQEVVGVVTGVQMVKKKGGTLATLQVPSGCGEHFAFAVCCRYTQMQGMPAFLLHVLQLCEQMLRWAICVECALLLVASRLSTCALVSSLDNQPCKTQTRFAGLARHL